MFGWILNTPLVLNISGEKLPINTSKNQLSSFRRGHSHSTYTKNFLISWPPLAHPLPLCSDVYFFMEPPSPLRTYFIFTPPPSPRPLLLFYKVFLNFWYKLSSKNEGNNLYRVHVIFIFIGMCFLNLWENYSKPLFALPQIWSSCYLKVFLIQEHVVVSMV